MAKWGKLSLDRKGHDFLLFTKKPSMGLKYTHRLTTSPSKQSAVVFVLFNEQTNESPKSLSSHSQFSPHIFQSCFAPFYFSHQSIPISCYFKDHFRFVPISSECAANVFLHSYAKTALIHSQKTTMRDE